MTSSNNNLWQKMRFTFRQSKHLPATALIEEHHGSHHISRVISSIAFVLLALLVWAACTHVDEIATAKGDIVPESLIKPIAHLEGGLIEKILVKNGAKVIKGQTLLTLDVTRALAELEKAQSRELTLALESERLKAFLSGKAFDVKQALKELTLQGERFTHHQDKIADLLKDEQALLQLENEVSKDKNSLIETQILQNRQVIISLAEQKILMQEQLTLLNQEKSYYDGMKNQGVFSDTEYLHLLRDISQAKSKQIKLIAETSKTENELSENILKLNELKTSSHRTALSEQADINADLLQLRRQIEKLHDHVKHTTITATDNGIVSGLDLTVGSIITPGTTLLSIVPQNVDLIVRAKVSPNDIGHVSTGERVKVKVNSYDYGRYGSVDGVVETLSASTLDDDNEMGPYYQAEIRLSQAFVGKNTAEYPLMSGMTVTADIITGEKTVLQYLLKPIHSTIKSSFHER